MRMIRSNCGRLAIGPICVAALDGSPSTIASARSAISADHFVVHAALHEEAAAGDARLPAGGEDPRHRADDGAVDVGVVEHDVRRLAAQLQRHGHERLRRRGGIAWPVATLPVKLIRPSRGSLVIAAPLSRRR